MNFKGEYVYVIEEREFIKCGEKIYKVGRSAHILSRMAQSPNGSQVRMLVNVNDSVKAEQEIRRQLKKYCDITHRKDIGAEYFQGNLCLIINVMSQVANMLYEERKDTIPQDAYLEESDSDSVCDSDDIGDTSTDASEDTEDMVDTKPYNNIEDPVVVINEYLANNTSDIEGQTVNAIDFYKTVMSATNLPKRFVYTRFVAILNKYKIKEYYTVRGPVFMFPVVPKPL
jgi:hypothetical protein